MRSVIEQMEEKKRSKMLPACRNLPVQRHLYNIWSILFRRVECSLLCRHSLRAPTFKLLCTFHAASDDREIFRSEPVLGRLNPSWRLPPDSVENQDFRATSVIVKLWIEIGRKTTLVRSALVDLSCLEHHIEDQINRVNPAFKPEPNQLLFRFRDGLYVHLEQETMPAKTSSSLPAASVDPILVLPSYGRDSLFRMVQSCSILEGTDRTKDQIQQCIIQHSWRQSISVEEMVKQKELLINSINGKRERCSELEVAITRQEEALEKLLLEAEERERRYENMKTLKEAMIMKTSSFRLEHNTKRKQYTSIRHLIIDRQRLMMSDLSFVYPIDERMNNQKVDVIICGVPLPRLELQPFKYKFEQLSALEEGVSVGLGFVARMVSLMSSLLDVPLRYPISYLGSRSSIWDHISESVQRTEREFPLYLQGKERHMFLHAVFLLNSNICQLRFACGMPTPDMCNTLVNLKQLLETQFLTHRRSRKAALAVPIHPGTTTGSMRGVVAETQVDGSSVFSLLKTASGTSPENLIEINVMSMPRPSQPPMTPSPLAEGGAARSFPSSLHCAADSILDSYTLL